MKDIAGAVSALSQEEITAFETEGRRSFVINGAPVELSLEDVEIISEDIPGWQVATDGKLTVALDITVTDELRYEGIAREFVNRIQNLRKEKGFEVTDKIIVHIGENEFVNEAVRRHAGYIGSQTLATEVKLVPSLSGSSVDEVDIDEVIVKVAIRKNTI